MDEFEVTEPASGRVFQIQLAPTILLGDPLNDYREARFASKDGVNFFAQFWRDPQSRGGHWSEEPGMVIVQDLTTEHIRTAIEDFAQRGVLEDTFEPQEM